MTAEPVRWTRRGARVVRGFAWLFAALLFATTAYVAGMLLMLGVLLYVPPL